MRTLEITAMFLLFVTLSQYIILLLRQPVTFSNSETNGESTMEVWAFLLNILDNKYFTVSRLELFSLKLFGPLQSSYNQDTSTSSNSS